MNAGKRISDFFEILDAIAGNETYQKKTWKKVNTFDWFDKLASILFKINI